MNFRIAAIWLMSLAPLFAAGAGKHFVREGGPLTEATSEAAESIGAKFLKQAAALYEVAEADLDSIYLVRQYKTDHNGVTHLRYRQRYGGIDVSGSDFTINLDRENRILNAGGAIFARPRAGMKAAGDDSLSSSIRSAMRSADPNSANDYTPMETGGKGATRRFHRPQQGDIDAKAVWFPVEGKLEAAWQFVLDGANGMRSAVTIHAGTQAVLESRPLTMFQSPPPPPRGLVFTGQSPQPNPRPGFAMTEIPAVVPRVLVSFAGDPQASPAGWLEGAETAGNNVIAGKNPLGQVFLANPVTAKSETRDFQFPLQLGIEAPNPGNFVEAATVNLFYWMNRSHDLFWHIGFNEAAGNYQQRNFGRGGIEGDPIYTYTQFGIQQTFGATLNNAFYTARGLEDGSPAMIGMFLGAGANGYFSDGSYDTEVMIHEYTHGVSLRLVPNLSGHHGGSMGEAWSDFFGLEFTVPDGAPLDGVYGVGDFLFQRLNVGIRTRPYSTRMDVNPITFADLGRVTVFPQIHQDAGIWVQSLWEMRANLIRQFGEPEGRRRTRLLVIDGMKMSIPAPTMVDARDAILLADRVNFNGESQGQIWAAFAKRGLGATAFAASNNSTRATASSAVPSPTGILSFSERSYVLGDPIRVILYDANLEGPVAVVQLTSYETGDLQTVRLTRDGPFYTGQVPTSPFAPGTREDGGLSVMPGSIISAYYNDLRAESGSRLVEISVPMQAPYVRTTRAPGFEYHNEQPLNLRAGTGTFQYVDLPFPFPFYGRNYSGLQVHANGLLAFDLPVPAACIDAALFRNMTGIAPFYMNIRTNGIAQPNQNVYVGRPSEDAITFRWVGETAVLPGFGVNAEPVNFGVTLFSDGRIEMAYGSGNRNLAFPAPVNTALNCSVSPVIGIANGLSNMLVTEYIGRSSLENAPRILFEPPSGAGSAPEVELEVPNATDSYEGILTGRATIWDQNHLVSSVYVLVDGTLRGQAGRTGACVGQTRPNCGVYGFNYNFEGLNLSPGTHQLMLRAVNSRGGITDRQVTFTVAASGQSRLPRVAIESPAADEEVSGNLMIRGYALAENLRVAGVDVLIDGITYGRAQYGVPRPEICSAAGITAPNCPAAGFQFSVNSATGAYPLPNGEHVLQVRIQDETGRFTLYPEDGVKFRVNNALNQPPTGVLVTPTHGQTVSGTILVYGYAYDPDGRIAAVQLLVDGAVRATLPYGEARTSECTALPEVAACPNIGFWHQWNTNTVLNGPHVLGIRLVDDRGRAVVVPQNAVNGLTLIVQN